MFGLQYTKIKSQEPNLKNQKIKTGIPGIWDLNFGAIIWSLVFEFWSFYLEFIWFLVLVIWNLKYYIQ